MARMKKVDLVAKIAKEQNLDPEQLNRLPMLELEKMDKVVPDSSLSDGDILGGDDTVSPTGAEAGTVVAQDSVSDAPVNQESATADETSSGSETSGNSLPSDVSGASEEPTPSEEEETPSEVKSPEGKDYIGKHPVTDAPVYE